MHAKNTVRYFLVIIAVILFSFFSNDFNLINVQSTAIVTAIAIDRENEEFSISAQIAIPAAKSSSGKSDSQGQSGGSGGGNGSFASIEGKGGTIAQAIEAINGKTGWYPKLVFCRLLILGQSLCESNVFDALDYFLRGEYVAHDCLLAAAEGKASEILAAKTPLGSTSSLAIEKVLSDQAMRVGASLPNTLREFSISYFSAAKSGYMPIVKKEKEGEDEIVSASETALFIAGKQIGKLDKRETFALACIKTPLRLAGYSVENEGASNTLTVKNNRRKLKFFVDGDQPKMEIKLTMYAGIADVSKSMPVEDIADIGDLPKGVLSVASEQLKAQLNGLIEKCRALSFDAFDAIGKLQKYEHKHFSTLKDSLIERMQVSLTVDFEGIR
ncbi:MAG: hypothetical protein IJX98_00200 [Clostridia bacterium]|nr:hypothetical protein [Clostridia bacterium]